MNNETGNRFVGRVEIRTSPAVATYACMTILAQELPTSFRHLPFIPSFVPKILLKRRCVGGVPHVESDHGIGVSIGMWRVIPITMITAFPARRKAGSRIFIDAKIEVT